MPDGALLTSPQVALRLGVSNRTVHRHVRDGRLIPAQQLPGPNGAFLFNPADVEDFVRREGEPLAAVP